MAVAFKVLEATEDRWHLDVPESLCSGFHDDHLQGYLLPDFRVGEKSIDPYDGGKFDGPELDILIDGLKEAIGQIRLKSENWPFNGEEVENYYARGRAYGLTLKPPRDQALMDLAKAIELAKVARSTNKALVFVGD